MLPMFGILLALSPTGDGTADEASDEVDDVCRMVKLDDEGMVVMDLSLFSFLLNDGLDVGEEASPLITSAAPHTCSNHCHVSSWS